MEVFQDYAYYYNLFYGDKEYSKEVKQIKQLIDVYLDKSEQITLLDIGCGTGKHDIELTKLGYLVKGIDLSNNMIEIATENYKDAKNISFEVGNAKTYKSDKKYDVVTSLFHVMSYLDNYEIIEAFQTAYAALNQGGVFVFDLWYGPGVLSDKPAVRVKKIEDNENIVIRTATPTMYPMKNKVDVGYDVLIINKNDSTVKTITETHTMQYYFTPEIKYLLEMAGFELKACLDCRSLKDATYDSWTAYFVAVKK